MEEAETASGGDIIPPIKAQGQGKAGNEPVGYDCYYAGSKYNDEKGKAGNDAPPLPELFPGGFPGGFIQEGRQENDKDEFRIDGDGGQSRYEADYKPGQDEYDGIGDFDLLSQHDQEKDDEDKDDIDDKVIVHGPDSFGIGRKNKELIHYLPLCLFF